MTANGKPDLPADEDIRPMIKAVSGNSAVWIFGSALAVAAGLLFYTLESRRNQPSAPSLQPSHQTGEAMIVAAPELAVPTPSLPDQLMSYDMFTRAQPAQFPAPTQAASSSRLLASPLAQGARPRAAAQAAPYEGTAAQFYQPPQPAVVYEAPASRLAAASSEADTASHDERAHAVRFRNPSSTIAKGTVIQAVLESALDSTRAGYARAIVTRDVFGFDGTQVLIERGSRLIGEYKADLAPGQNRALIQWQRLMRPDGIMIDIDSPSADPLGRVGVKGSVNTHFFQRFGGAILQSALDIGVQIAANKATNGTIVYAFPGSLQGLVAQPAEKVQPTLKVRQGTSVSVFVARDLDFTTGGQ